uniref:UspA domain-containing protein n=1 Tax=Setaria viridis TaxID=4556 RepID=A0A4U6SXI7_SETVI|nr:hypothetical protein SEVIR_9G243700v2 [Setaria viridis]
MKVLVAVDDSDFSRHALAWVLDHLFPFPAAAADQPAEEPRPALVLVHALEPLRHIMYPIGPGSAVYGAPSMMQSVRAAQAENARSLLDRAKRTCHQRGVTFFFLCLPSVPTSYRVLVQSKCRALAMATFCASSSAGERGGGGGGRGAQGGAVPRRGRHGRRAARRR